MVRPGRRRFHQQRLIPLVMDPVQEAGDCAFGAAVRGDTCRLESLPCSNRRMVSEPGGKNITAVEAIRRRRRNHVNHCLRCRFRFYKRSWAVENQECVDGPIIEQRFERGSVASAWRIADNIHRIAVTPGPRQHLVQRGNRLRP